MKARRAIIQHDLFQRYFKHSANPSLFCLRVRSLNFEKQRRHKTLFQNDACIGIQAKNPFETDVHRSAGPLYFSSMLFRRQPINIHFVNSSNYPFQILLIGRHFSTRTIFKRRWNYLPFLNLFLIATYIL